MSVTPEQLAQYRADLATRNLPPPTYPQQPDGDIRTTRSEQPVPIPQDQA